MGRVKLKIKRLENMNGRQATYAKRKNGIMKKANELAILCDIKIILLMFSPTGKPSLCRGNHSIEDMIEKFAQLSPQDRAKRKLESLEVLKKTFQKLDHEVNISDFLGTSSQAVEDLTNQARLLQNHLSELHKRLSYWTNLDKITNIELLGHLENSLRDSLNRIRAHKENLGNQQLLSLDCNNQFQNSMHLPFSMVAEQQLQPVQWMPNGELQQVVLRDDPNNLSHRDVECSASSSFGSYPSFFSTGKPSEISNSGPENGVNGFFSELNETVPSRLQLNGQSPYITYNMNLLTDVKYQPTTDMSIQESPPADFHLNGSFEAPRPEYNPTPCSWPSASAPYAVNMFDERLYSQQPN